MKAITSYPGFKVIDFSTTPSTLRVDNSQCPHLHYVNDEGRTRCQTCGHDNTHISGAVYPAIETAYGRTVDHGFNIRVF